MWDGRVDLTLNVSDAVIDNDVVTTAVSFPALVDPTNPDRFRAVAATLGDVGIPSGRPPRRARSWTSGAGLT